MSPTPFVGMPTSPCGPVKSQRHTHEPSLGLTEHASLELRLGEGRHKLQETSRWTGVSAQLLSHHNPLDDIRRGPQHSAGKQVRGRTGNPKSTGQAAREGPSRHTQLADSVRDTGPGLEGPSRESG